MRLRTALLLLSGVLLAAPARPEFAPEVREPVALAKQSLTLGAARRVIEA